MDAHGGAMARRAARIRGSSTSSRTVASGSPPPAGQATAERTPHRSRPRLDPLRLPLGERRELMVRRLVRPDDHRTHSDPDGGRRHEGRLVQCETVAAGVWLPSGMRTGVPDTAAPPTVSVAPHPGCPDAVNQVTLASCGRFTRRMFGDWAEVVAHQLGHRPRRSTHEPESHPVVAAA